MSDVGAIDEKRMRMITFKILKAEQDNLRTREKNSDEMVDKIRRTIIDEVNRRGDAKC